MTRAHSSLLPLALVLAVSTVACSTASRDDDQVADTTAAVATETTASAGSADTQTGFLDPNAATREQLAALPGMDSAAVNAVISGRPFDNMLGVDRALGSDLTEVERDSVYTRLWKPIDLNSASGDEILLIPGVGPRMRREFLEYRPYNSIEKFRREIGKYVDSAEVARLERYVTIR
jgi:DNA uptake protein ComE-like DNA-binding protein